MCPRRTRSSLPTIRLMPGPASGQGGLSQGQAQRFQPAAALPVHDLAETARTAQGRRDVHHPLRGREHVPGDRRLRPQAPPDAEPRGARHPDRLSPGRSLQAGLSLLLDGRGPGREEAAVARPRSTSSSCWTPPARPCSPARRNWPRACGDEEQICIHEKLDYTKAAVCRLDFSDFNTPGEYRVFVPGIGAERAVPHRRRRVGEAVQGGHAGDLGAAAGHRPGAARLHLHAQAHRSIPTTACEFYQMDHSRAGGAGSRTRGERA